MFYETVLPVFGYCKSPTSYTITAEQSEPMTRMDGKNYAELGDDVANTNSAI